MAQVVQSDNPMVKNVLIDQFGIERTVLARDAEEGYTMLDNMGRDRQSQFQVRTKDCVQIMWRGQNRSTISKNIPNMKVHLLLRGTCVSMCFSVLPLYYHVLVVKGRERLKCREEGK